ncbi:bifunctional glutamine-synthetase adenylyltransferase/deadenyltransferase [compost metagenome]
MKKITTDVAEMRALIAEEKPPRDIWDFKLIPGGLIDIEFIAQYLRLIAPARAGSKDLPVDTYGLSTAQALKALGEDLPERADLDTCLEALRLFTELSQIIRLCVDGPFDAKDAPTGLVERICRAGDCPDLVTLEGEVKRLSGEVRGVFERVMKR